MGRNVTADRTPLLLDAEQNIGNSAIVYPQSPLIYPQLPPNYVNPITGTVIPQSNPARILNLAAGGSAAGQTMTVAMSATRILQGADNPNPGFPGPITGVVEFGNGGRFTKLEFDLPVGPFAGFFNAASSAIQPQDGVIIITVPAGALRVYARYDNLLLAPLLGTDPPISQAEWYNQNNPGSPIPIVGPGGPLIVENATATGNVIVPAEPVLVQAMATYFGRAPTRARVYKTLNILLSEETTISPPPAPDIKIGDPPVQTIAGFQKFNFWALPAYTKRIRILRFNYGGAVDMQILLHDGIRPVEFFHTGTVDQIPEYDIEGSESIIGINCEAGVHMLKIICEVGL